MAVGSPDTRVPYIEIIVRWIVTIASVRGDDDQPGRVMSTRDRTAVEPRFALFAIAGLIVLAVIVAALTTSFDRHFRQPAPLTRDHAPSLRHA